MLRQVQSWNTTDDIRTDSMYRIQEMWSHVQSKWNTIQVGRQGQYSIERLESLDHYCKTTSKTRVFLVCASTPLPALATTLLLELVPLQPPADGWVANWVFWIRITIICYIMTCLGMLVLRRLVLALPFTVGKIMVIAIGVSIGFTGFALLLAVVIGFPVPFVLLIGGIPNILVIGAMLLLTFGIAPFRSTSPLRPHLKKFRNFLFAHENLIAIYPLVKVLYAFVPPKYQGFAMLMLPLWKFGAKKYVVHAIQDLEDFVPGIVAFNVDYFSTLFVSVCMYSSGSILVSVLAILVDLLIALLEFRELRMNANVVYNLLRDQKIWSKNHLCRQDTKDLLMLMLEVVRNPESRDMESLPSVRLWACEPHPLSSDRLDGLYKLETLAVYVARSTPAKQRTSIIPTFVLKQQTRRISVQVATTGPVEKMIEKQSHRPHDSPRVLESSGDFQTSEHSKNLVVQGLQLLFHCEYLVLVAYVECIVPIVFVTYKSVLHQLPNVVYAPGGTESWNTGAVGNIILLGVLEVCSFLVLKVLLERKFALYPFYQLAYVLETQVELVQIDVFIATIVLLPFELEHFGMDFTLHFEWLGAKSP